MRFGGCEPSAIAPGSGSEIAQATRSYPRISDGLPSDSITGLPTLSQPTQELQNLAGAGREQGFAVLAGGFLNRFSLGGIGMDDPGEFG
jgi:hypothetical protein